MTKRTHLTMEQRIKILDWLRLHADDLPNMLTGQIVARVSEELGRTVTLAQIRDIAKAGRIRWAFKPTARGGAKRMPLRDKVAQLEMLVAHLYTQLDLIPPEQEQGLPDDDAL